MRCLDECGARAADDACADGRGVVWPFFSTPFSHFAAVMGPIAGSMAVLAALAGVPGIIRITAGLVAVLSVYGLIRGYAYRIKADSQVISYRGPGRHIRIPWHEVRHVDRYTPLDRNRTTQYVYVTRLEEPPADWREIDADTIQLQDRPGLLETLARYCRDAQAKMPEAAARDETPGRHLGQPPARPAGEE